MQSAKTIVDIVNKAKQVQHENNAKTRDKPYMPLANSTMTIYTTNINKLYREVDSDKPI